MKMYLLSNGEVAYSPTNYSARTELKNRAKALEKIIKAKTRKLTGADLQDLLNTDPDVIEYRQLVRDVWAWKTDVFAVREVTTCDHCKQYTKPVFKTVMHGSYTFENFLCEDCLCKQKEIFDDGLHTWEILEEISNA